MLNRLIKLAAVAALDLTPFTAAAEWKPDRPINIIVGFSAGGGTDATARLIAWAAQEHFPVPLVFVNRPGASGTLAAELVAGSSPCWTAPAAFCLKSTMSRRRSAKWRQVMPGSSPLASFTRRRSACHQPSFVPSATRFHGSSFACTR
ncbi:hypothetical protein [Actibacterium mucosum]|uniref:hypothetical protein n=1 Tax=Actibacterium mucosum TaxID=1087332 RepID=UPI001F245C4E|nr:hypothetical protein [Actibacterium mucosum]